MRGIAKLHSQPTITPPPTMLQMNPSLPCIRSDDADVFRLEERLRIFACKTQEFSGKQKHFVLPLLGHQGCLARSAGSHESVRSSTTVALASDHGCYLAICKKRNTAMRYNEGNNSLFCEIRVYRFQIKRVLARSFLMSSIEDVTGGYTKQCKPKQLA